jgi:DNA-binding beta-propeller fold protein YncE
MFRKSTVLALAGSLWITGAALAASLGQVVPIGGAAADVALDEARGKLYIANFTANRIEVMSLASKTIQTSINVSSQPSSLSVSPDGHWLLVSHFGNRAVPASPSNGLTLIDLRNNNAKQAFTLPNPPLGVAFGIDNKALVVTTAEFISFDPTFGTTQLIGTIQNEAAKALPQPPQSFPPQITQASVGASADGYFIWGLGDQIMFRYNVIGRNLITTTYSGNPKMAPRVVAVSNDGAQAAMGYWLSDIDPNFNASTPSGRSLSANCSAAVMRSTPPAASFTRRSPRIWRIRRF